MAVSPVILNKLPFDAELELKLQFTYSGSQVFAYRVVIQDNTTNSVVYDQKTSGQNGTVLNAIASVPAGTLTNGNTYNFQISVFDHLDEESPLSTVVVLKALKTPVFTFENITDNDIVHNSYLDVNILYEQENGELLNVYTVNLYSSSQTLVWTSGTIYAGVNTVQISNLLDNTTYYVQATGQTVNGIEMETALVQLSCDYVKPDLFLKFRAENVSEEGSVRLSANFILVEGETNADSLVYIDDQKVSLLNGEQIWFDDGFVADNWVCELVLSDMVDFSKIVTFNMQSAIATLTWNYGEFVDYDEPMYYMMLTAYSFAGLEQLTYVQYSNKIPELDDGQQLFVFIRHIDGAFDITIEALTETETEEVVDETTVDETEGGEA